MAKTRFTTRKKQTTTTLDMLSSLSDDLLLCIIGHLETLDAVRTCVLSRRWRTLWKSLPSISFVGPLLRDTDKRQRAFSDFVTQVLLRRDNSNLVKFRLCPPRKTDPSLVKSSLDYAIKHNVKFIQYFEMGSYYEWSSVRRGQNRAVFPRCFFYCSSLQGLELRYDSHRDWIRWPRRFNWPALKSLHLESFVVGEANFDGRIFSRCPSLETLKLQFIQANKDLKGDTFDIHSLSLRSLELVCMNFLYAHMIDIVAPKLTTFRYSSWEPVNCSVDAPSLENVTINIHPGADIYSSSQVSLDDDARETIVCSIKMVNEFRMAKSLSISAATVKVLSALPYLLEEHLLKFENLKDLKLTTSEPLQLGECSTIFPHILSYFINSSTAFKLQYAKATL